MRTFFSYGPVDCERHFCVPRKELIQRCLHSLIGDPEKGGHYFTIWAPRQTGKTWLMRQVTHEVLRHHADRFAIHTCSFGDLRGMADVPATLPDDTVPKAFTRVIKQEFPGEPVVETWEDFRRIFSREQGLWKQPLILFIDEFDTAPPGFMDLIIGRFREMYLKRETHWLHGLALIGVRAVLGVDSRRGSPFNIQRSVHVPNLTKEEVHDLYQQYQEESGQKIEQAVVDEVFRATQGQPGLTCWLGELLTETYNPGKAQVIDISIWKRVWMKARFKEPNNTLMNLIAKAREPEYQPFLLKLFSHSDIPFTFHDPLHNYLYLHGILDSEEVTTDRGDELEICRFASPLVQQCLYDALGTEIVEKSSHVLPLHPLDELTDVFEDTALNIPILLTRYKDYLKRLKAKGINPWKEQPRRKTDFQLTEAVGHFHLYAWLRDAVGSRCIVSPEFPTGNGKVDVHLKCDEKRGLIEIKSFVDAYQLKKGRGQAAGYAKSLGMNAVTLVVFLPVDDESILEQLSGKETIDGVRVTVVAIGWV